ncbi:MAG: hypothetical protein ACXIVG_02615 [Pararhodobacter sp.]
MRLCLTAFALAASVLPASPLPAQSLPCAPREQMLRIVIDQLGETRQATGAAGRGAQMALFASESGSWTMLLFLHDGRACLLANGTGFRATGGLQPARGNPA